VPTAPKLQRQRRQGGGEWGGGILLPSWLVGLGELRKLPKRGLGRATAEIKFCTIWTPKKPSGGMYFTALGMFLLPLAAHANFQDKTMKMAHDQRCTLPRVPKACPPYPIQSAASHWCFLHLHADLVQAGCPCTTTLLRTRSDTLSGLLTNRGGFNGGHALTSDVWTPLALPNEIFSKHN